MAAVDALTGWEALGAAIATARAELAAVAPDAATAVEAEPYLMRVVTNCLDDGFLAHLFTERGLTEALPTRGGPNPDYVMYHALLDPAGRYRLEGNLHDSERAGVGLYSFGPAGEALLAGYAAFDRATAESDGHFSLDIAADASGPGTLKTTPSSRVLLIRVLHRAAQGRPCALTLVGASSPGLALATGSTDGALTQASHIVLRSVRQFVRWSQVTSANPNRFIAAPPDMEAEVQGDPDTSYRLGYYALGDGEWLEATIPPGLRGYWSLHAYNHWCESLPGAGAHDLSALPDPDGQIRVRIGPAVPSDLANRVDTQGRRRGVLIFRAIGSGVTPIPGTAIRRG